MRIFLQLYGPADASSQASSMQVGHILLTQKLTQTTQYILIGFWVDPNPRSLKLETAFLRNNILPLITSVIGFVGLG